MKITKNTKLKEVIKTPVGHDALARIMHSIGLEKNVLNGFILNLRIKDIKMISLGKLDDSFIDSLLSILNSQTEIIKEDNAPVKHEWWKEATFYEIYPRSFNDSNGDGIGDLQGIIEKLDYLKDLGVDCLWIGPFYDSPNADNGYDVRNYKKIMKEFGTMKDCDKLIKEVHKRDMHIIIDLVMNHTSDEHEFFKKSLKGEDKYKDYYIWKTSKEIPNNWTSLFAGPAWTYYSQRKQWVLHLFAEKQIDLNWDNPNVRNEMYDIANYWLDKGADGFRLDVVSFISKDNFKDGNDKLAKLIGFRGIEHYFHGPHLDKYLKEFNDKCLKPHNAYTVGECPGNGLMMSRLITGDDRNELSELFSFDHLDNPGKIRFDIYDFNIKKMLNEMFRWQTSDSNHCWPTVFLNNHDNPRMVSKIDPSGKYRDKLSKMLATLEFTLRGTPYLYQGEEIGMGNYPFSDLSEYKDIETLQGYKEMLKTSATHDELMAKLKKGSRDNARTPMCWDNKKNAGFTTGTPWLKANPDYKEYNVKKEEKDKDSILNYYKKLIKYRKEHLTLVYGDFKLVKDGNSVVSYVRKDDEHEYQIVLNLTDSIKRYPVIKGELVFSNYEDTSILHPYQADVYLIK